MKVNKLSSGICALALIYASHAYAEEAGSSQPQIQINLDRQFVRAGNNMLKIQTVVPDIPSGISYTITPVTNVGGVTFTPVNSGVNRNNNEVTFVASGASDMQPGKATFRVTGKNLTAGRANVDIVAADAQRMVYTNTNGIVWQPQNSNITGALNGNVLVYSVDGSKTFKSATAPEGATGVQLIKLAQNKNRAYVVYYGTPEVTEINAVNGKVLRNIPAPQGTFEAVTAFIGNSNDGKKEQVLITYSGSSVSTLIKRDGLIVFLESPQKAYESASVWETGNGGIVITYKNSQTVTYVNANGEPMEIAPPADANDHPTGLNNGVFVQSAPNGLSVIYYTGATVAVIEPNDNIRYVKGPKDAILAYTAYTTPSNQVIVSFYKQLFPSQYDGHSNDILVIDSNSSKIISLPETQGAGGFATAAPAGNSMILSWYKHNALYGYDVFGNIRRLELPTNAVVGNSKANVHNYSEKTGARLIAFDNTPELLLVTDDLKTKVIKAPEGAKAVLWVNGSYKGTEFAVTYESFTKYKNLGSTLIVSSNGSTRLLETAYKRLKSSKTVNGVVVSAVYDDTPVVDVFSCAADNFVIRYQSGYNKVVFANGHEEIIRSPDNFTEPNVYMNDTGSLIIGFRTSNSSDLLYFSKDGHKKTIKPVEGAATWGEVFEKTDEGEFAITFKNQEQRQNPYLYAVMPEVKYISVSGDETTIPAPTGASYIRQGSDRSGAVARNTMELSRTGQLNIQYEYNDSKASKATTLVTKDAQVIYW